MKQSIITAAIIAAFSTAALAYDLPARPDAPTAEQWTPTAPVYQAPTLLDYTRAEPTVLDAPTYPTQPVKDYPEVAPPTTAIYFSETGLQNGFAPYFVAASKADVTAAIESYYSTLPLFGESDYYTNDQLLQVDKVQSFSTYQPNFNVNTMVSNFVVYDANYNRVLSTDAVENIAAVLRGETVTIDGREVNSVLVDVGGSPILYTPEGAFGVMFGEPAYLAQTTQDALAQIEGYLADVAAGTYVTTWPADWQIGNAVNVASPSYTTYESYIQPFIPQMTAYREAYNAWLDAVVQFSNDSAAYSASLADYAAWQSDQPVMLTPEKPSALTAGIGHYNGQTAVGVAVTAAVRPTVVTSFGAGFSNGGKAALRAGISFSF